MSEYQLFLQERDKMDVLLQKGYKITNVLENLSGAFVDFCKEEEKETLHIVTPEGRKYFAVMLIKQQKEGA
ncbi:MULTISPECIES: hypothetical protein [Sutcliffiella]|uniref:Uncharacterized protein n=1 Tax=Sutcliffiella cohnii TaxID=33932 RepID=A0A223KNV4_9BACI|nr:MULTISPECIES: hypothetical protein [Sutcliffiella]AST91044.1 hypothetical protein BC6307_07000 [Sutcliffiella cohnii]WBL16845.1 hypothetical protein O1A01_09490 [Sutcliffiella sp. NC1]